tara:strand:+ start:995 stop:2374 length:1380 start_codon:yes stop_codon:yes gene_type:complete
MNTQNPAIQNMGAKRYLSIACSNGGSGVYGSSVGSSQLRFDIANVGKLQTQELRLQGTFRIRNVSGGAVGGVANNALNTDIANEVNVNAYLGTQSFIDSVEIGSRINSQKSIEKINNYGQLVSSLHSALHSKGGYDHTLMHEQGGMGFGFSSHVGNDTTPQLLEFTQAGQLNNNRKPFLGANGLQFDMRLMTGMFMGQPEIDLETLGGMTITINCADNNQVLYGVQAGSFQYEIVNPRIVVPIMDKTPQEQMASMQSPVTQLNFLTYTSLYNTLSSTDQQVVSRVNLQAVVSCINHYIPVSHVNNSTRDGYAQYNPGIRQLTYLKDGKRTPLEYQVSVDRDPDATLTTATQPSTTPELLVNYLDAFRNFRDVKKSCINPIVSGFVNQTAEAGCWGTGVSYDDVGHNGINASASTLGMEIQSDLDDPLARTATTPFAVYTFYLTRASVQVSTNGQLNVQM